MKKGKKTYNKSQNFEVSVFNWNNIKILRNTGRGGRSLASMSSRNDYYFSDNDK